MTDSARRRLPHHSLMLIRMLTSIAGPTLSAGPGQEIEMDQPTALRLLASGQAEAVRRATEAAVTTTKRKEAATTPRPGRA